jgi:hypothetical protein
MAWTKKTVNGMLVATETVTLAASATYAYTSEIDFLNANPNSLLNKYVGLVCTASAVTGTNVDISLHGGITTGTAGGSMPYVLDAPGSIADVTNSAKTKVGIFDIKAYPFPYYRIGLLCDVDESANTMTVTITVPTAAI